MSTGQENYVIATLSEDAFWSVNKAIGRAHGIEHAVLIAELIYKFKYWRERGQLDNARGFFYTSADIQKVLGVSERAAKRLTKSVQDTGFVKVKKRGQPAKNYWYIQFEVISEFLSQAETVPTGQDETGLSSEGETVPAITKKSDKEINTNNKTASPVAAPQVNDLLKMIYDQTPNRQSLFADHAIRKAASKAIEQDGFEVVSASLTAYLGNAWVKTNNAYNFKKFFNDKSERERFKPAHVVKTERQETEAERMAKEWGWMSGTESEILDKMVERYRDPAKLPKELDEWKDRYLKRYEECSKKFVADMERSLAAI